MFSIHVFQCLFVYLGLVVAKCTFLQGHPELPELHQAKDGMMDLAEYINEVKRDNEMLQIIKDLQVSHE